jgi:Skp family chaperone for outer membrane proteins
MKSLKILLAVVFILAWCLSKAQTTAPKITDEDLKKYAKTQDSIKVMQETLTQIIAQNVQQNTVMPVARYNELYKIANDQAKLTAAQATQAETEFLKEIADLRQYNIERINATYQALAKDYVGLKTFNTIKKSLDTDSALKTRYESINQEIQSSRQSTTNKGGR